MSVTGMSVTVISVTCQVSAAAGGWAGKRAVRVCSREEGEGGRHTRVYREEVPLGGIPPWVYTGLYASLG